MAVSALSTYALKVLSLGLKRTLLLPRALGRRDMTRIEMFARQRPKFKFKFKFKLLHKRPKYCTVELFSTEPLLNSAAVQFKNPQLASKEFPTFADLGS